MSKRIFLSFIPGFFLFVGAISAHAQVATTSQPDIQTYNTATSSLVIISAPAGYKSEVITNYVNGQYQTFATSTPLTSTDIQNMQNEIEEQETEMNQIFQEQQQLFQQQEAFFQNLWEN